LSWAGALQDPGGPPEGGQFNVIARTWSAMRVS
jgi:hypothetical protein